MVAGNLGIAPPYLVNRCDSVHELAVKTEGALIGS